jgi:ribosomal protein S18 acetylase RimI-like enzyme
MARLPSNQTSAIIALDQPASDLVDAMVQLFVQGQEPHHVKFPEHFGPADDHAAITEYFRGFFGPRNPLRKLLKTRTGFAIGWFVEGVLSGYLLYRLQRTNNVFYGAERWTCFIEDIVVDEKTRGLGGATMLMDAVLTEAGSHKNCAISGTVWNANSASEALFRKHGFAPLSCAFYKVIP